MNKTKPVLLGIIGGLGLIGIYFSIISVLNSFDYALSQFTSMWYWFVALSIGFGIQLGFYVHIKTFDHEKVHGASASVATSGGVSTGAMIACCLHHVAELLPLLGLSAAAIFLTRYQIPFIIVGIFSNLIGITIMLYTMQQHRIFDPNGALSKIFRWNMKKIRHIVIIISILSVAYSFINTYYSGYY